MAAGSNTITLPTSAGTFAFCDEGTNSTLCTNAPKSICVTGAGAVTGSGYGPQAPGTTLCGTIASVSNTLGSRIATVSFATALPTPAYGIANFNVSSSGSGYTAGDTVTLTVGSLTPLDSLFAIQRVEEVSALTGTVVNQGSGGSVSGVCGVIGTLGTVRTGGAGHVQALVTLTSTGSIMLGSPVSITQGGDYTQDPPGNIDSVVGYSNSSSVTACTGLTGAMLSLSFGVVATTPVKYGYYANGAVNGTSASQTSTSGTGNGLTLTTVGGFFPVSGIVTWGTDNTTAFSNAVSLVNSARQAGVNALLYVPPGQCASTTATATSCTLTTPTQTGAYFFGLGATYGTPPFMYGGGIVTDGDNDVTFYMSKAYAPSPNSAFTSIRPLISWFSDGEAEPTPFDGTGSSFSNQFGPSLNGGLTIVGDTTASPMQVGMAFCGDNYFAEIHDYQFRNLPGTGLLYGCLAYRFGESHNRESRFYNIRGFNSGASPGSIGGTLNYPAVDINTQVAASGSADMDDVGFDNVELFGNHGAGIVVHASHGLTNTMSGNYTPGSIGFVNFTGRVRVEGLAPDGTTLDGPLIQIGDSSTSPGMYAQVMDGDVHDVSFPAGMQLVDPYFNYAAFLVTGTGANTPSNITTGPGTTVTGGPAYGNGFDIEYCNSCSFNIQTIQVSGTSYIQGAASNAGTVTLQLPAGATAKWSTSIDPTAVISQPAAFLSTGALATSTAAVAAPVLTPFTVTGTNAISLAGTSFTTAPSTDQITGNYYSIGPLNCVDLTGTLVLTSTVPASAGPLHFYLPIAASASTDGIPVTGLQGSITWPSLGASPATQLLFFPTPGQNYGQIAFQASGYNIIALGSQLRASSFATGTTYSFSVNGCYR